MATIGDGLMIVRADGVAIAQVIIALLTQLGKRERLVFVSLLAGGATRCSSPQWCRYKLPILCSDVCFGINAWDDTNLLVCFLDAKVNEETGNRRPVMLTLLRVPRLSKTVKENNGQELERTLEEGKEMESKVKEEKANGTTRIFLGLVFIPNHRLNFFTHLYFSP